MTESETIGLVAGNGRFPLLFAQSARRLGHRVVAVAHRGETDPALEASVHALTWVKLGQLGKVIDALQRAGVRRAVWAGGLDKKRIFANARPDLRGLRILATMKERGDDALLRALAREFEGEGIQIVAPTDFMPERMARPGPLGRRAPDEVQRADVALGLELARKLGALDVGQTVVLKDGIVVALEAIEGTDACIRRGGELAKKGAVVVKVAKPGQDMRFDVPAIGPATIAVMREVRAAVLVVEAGRTLILDEEELVAAADKAGIAVLGA